MAVHERVVNLHHVGQLDPGVVYVGRARPEWGLPATDWGNPFPPGKDGVEFLDQSLALYAAHLREAGLDVRARRELAGLRLACWCAPRLCHASLLAWVADGLGPDDALARVLADQHPTLF